MAELPPILCISNMAWEAEIPTNRQQLMSRFARRTHVAVVEAPLPVAGSFVGRSRGRIRHGGWRLVDGVRVLQVWDWVPYPLARHSRTLSQIADAAFSREVLRRWRRLGWQAPVLWLYPPDSADLLGRFGECLSLYHCVDDYVASARYVGYQRVAPYAPAKREATLARAVDVVIATSPRLAERWKQWNPNIHLMPNVADTELFAQALDSGREHPLLERIPAPRVAYVGALDAYKVNFDLLVGLALACPEIQFVCVGPIGIGDGTRSSSLPQASNLHYVGVVPQADLPSLLRGCGVCLIPYQLNDYTAGVSPLKLYEYLAAGQPVIATPLPALQADQPRGLFLVDAISTNFAAAVRQALAIDSATRQTISTLARSHSWDRRVDELEALILGELASKYAARATMPSQTAEECS